MYAGGGLALTRGFDANVNDVVEALEESETSVELSLTRRGSAFAATGGCRSRMSGREERFIMERRS